MVIVWDDDFASVKLYHDIGEKPYEVIPIEDLLEVWERRNDIVRCKECKYGDVLDHYESGCCGCKNGLLGYITADDFCSYGERREP